MAPEPLSIAQAFPVRRSGANPAARFATAIADEFERRGHEVLRISTGDPVKRLLKGRDLDIVHVHDPFAPSVASAALRHSYSLNVATFHAPQERVLTTQVARPLVEIFFGRIDARTVTPPETAELLERFFPADYELVGAEAADGGDDAGWGAGRRRDGSDLPAPAGSPPRPDREPGGPRADRRSGR